MHSLYDLILEAVINSEEAGAGNVDISLLEKDGQIFVTVEDDGTFEVEGDAFSLGYSSKGKYRGKGLWHIRNIDRDAMLCRAGKRTILRFSVPITIPHEPIEDGLFPIFQRVGSTTLSYTKDDKMLFSISRKRDRLQTVKEITSFKNEIRAIKGEHDV